MIVTETPCEGCNDGLDAALIERLTERALRTGPDRRVSEGGVSVGLTELATGMIATVACDPCFDAIEDEAGAYERMTRECRP